MGIILVLGASTGLCWSAMNTSLLRPVRNRYRVADMLLSCPLCTGFHAGWICCVVFLVLGPWVLVPFVASLVAGLVLHDRT